MFAKLRTAKYLKARATFNESVVEFAGKVQSMVRVHHYGLRDRISKGGKVVQYESRPLLGISNKENDLIEEIIFKYLLSR